MNGNGYNRFQDIKLRKLYKAEVIGEEDIPKDSAIGEIVFRRNKKKSKIKILIKGAAFILIASVSGAVSAMYFVENIYEVNFSELRYKNFISGYLRTENITSITSLKNSINYVAETVSPAVVGISNNEDNFLDKTINKATGSGIIIDSYGHILTNYHIVEGTDKILVKLSGANSRPISASILGYDKTYDLALLKIDIEGLPSAKLGDSTKLKVGDLAIAIGNPLGEEFSGSVTAGIISATNRRISSINPYSKEQIVYDAVQTDADINIWNNGGPLCNEAGEVIGLSSTKLGSEINGKGMNFAISINQVKKFIEDIKNSENAEGPQLGIYGKTVDENILNLKGVYVLQVYYGYGAAEAGIRPMDVITEVNGRRIEKLEDLNKLIEGYKEKDIVSCKVYRDGKEIELKVTLKNNNSP